MISKKHSRRLLLASCVVLLTDTAGSASLSLLSEISTGSVPNVGMDQLEALPFASTAIFNDMGRTSGSFDARSGQGKLYAEFLPDKDVLPFGVRGTSFARSQVVYTEELTFDGFEGLTQVTVGVEVHGSFSQLPFINDPTYPLTPLAGITIGLGMTGVIADFSSDYVVPDIDHLTPIFQGVQSSTISFYGADLDRVDGGLFITNFFINSENPVIGITYSVSAVAGGGAIADFGQTANMFIELEHGVTFASESGHFLTDPAFERDGAVPAMPPAALTLAGIFALGVRARVTGRTRTSRHPIISRQHKVA